MSPLARTWTLSVPVDSRTTPVITVTLVGWTRSCWSMYLPSIPEREGYCRRGGGCSKLTEVDSSIGVTFEANLDSDFGVRLSLGNVEKSEDSGLIEDELHVVDCVEGASAQDFT